MQSVKVPTTRLGGDKASRSLLDADCVTSNPTAVESAAKRLKSLLDRLDRENDRSFDLQGCERFLDERDSREIDATHTRYSEEFEAELWDTVPNVLPGQARSRNEKNTAKRTSPRRRASPAPTESVRLKCSMCPSIFDNERTLRLHQFAKHRAEPLGVEAHSRQK